MKLFKELNKQGTTVLIATHDETLMKRFPSPTLRLQDQRVVLPQAKKSKLRLFVPEKTEA